MEVIVHGDIESALVAWVQHRLWAYARAVPVSATVPTPRPAEFVTATLIGGSWRDIVTETATIAVECWADLPSEAASLAQLTRGIIHATLGRKLAGLTIYRVQESAGPALLPDPDSAQVRYVFTVSLDVRGSAATQTNFGSPATP